MKKIIRLGFYGGLFIVLLMLGHILYLYSLSIADSYPKDDFLSQQTNKTALIIVAHDDDAISMSGTITQLVQNGWEIRLLCFYQGYKNKDQARKKDLLRASVLLGIKGVEFYDVEMRKNLKNIEKPWLPIPYSDFDSAYSKTKVFSKIEKFIQKYNPSVIFSLDDVIGGYGHPDHVFVSKLIVEYCRQHHLDSTAGIEQIYQAVFDPEMNERILKDLEAFKLTKTIYQVARSPKPDVFFSLKGQEETKKQALLTYSTEQNSLTKIWPYYAYYPANIYFKIFDKEYYRVLNKSEYYR